MLIGEGADIEKAAQDVDRNGCGVRGLFSNLVAGHPVIISSAG
jgi:hypothetical protein